MFEKNDVIFSGRMGICRVEDITKLVESNTKMVSYYVLRSLVDKRVAYIPVEDHEVLLRELISKEEARRRIESGEKLEEMEKLEIQYVLEDAVE